MTGAPRLGPRILEEDTPVKRTPVASRALALLPAALLAIPLLAGCATGTSASEALPDGCVAPGSASDSIKVTGDFGGDLNLATQTPIAADGFQRTVLDTGEGEEIAEGDTFVGHLNIFVGSTGEPYAQEATRHVLDSEGLAPWYFDTMTCASGGDRIASTVPAVDMLGEGGGLPAGIADDDTMIVVVDLRAVLSEGEGRAVGSAQEVPASFPQVTLAEDGAPTVTIPAGVSGLAEFAATPSIVGSGARVEDGQTVLVHSQGLIARTGEVFEQSWGGAAISFPLDEVIPGFRDGLVGQTVGSQVVIIVPPGTGYSAEDLELMGYQATDVMVYVVDILDAG